MECKTCEHKETEIREAMKLLRAWVAGHGNKSATEHFLDYLVGQPTILIAHQNGRHQE